MEKKKNWYVNQKKFHIVYKTTCKITGKYYIGMHSTDNLDDGYLGSGTILGHSIRKHGKENHSIEVLEFLADRESLRKRERQIVCEEVIGDKFCMNLRLGGEGWESREASKAAILGNQSEARTKNPKWIKKISDYAVIKHSQGKLKSPDRTGSSITEEHKKKIGSFNAIHQAGSGNSQFGTMWIFSDVERRSKKVKKDFALSGDWKIGRKMKFAG